MRTIAAALLLAALLAAAPQAYAQEGRAFNPIARPAARPALPDGAVRVNPPIPVTREEIARAMDEVAQAWNDRRLESILAPGFQRRAELADAMQAKVPRDASLRVTAIQGWQVLDQWRLGGALVSRVSVTVRTQVEFSDAAGFQARDGTNEWVMTIRTREGGP
ncbi:MAG TPA: hypothetical protein PLO00_00180 [Usitatibacteraceae bacterium]|nr:hypothetical protein [Usitatibacteraceae bacterium]